ncbi:ArsR/SmtB family transcription factor [Halorubrum distributum]|uniref:DNA binding domain-containing protein n=1 Tax=Halorubrum distributum JCM 13916 TaxID=1230455 RepID=M0PRS1_9EURY|nr:winged helix-turn-helix domain-containing protein [Halorubrum arcis]EMA72733.1 DNA binding domain-containing protein [Halorubrum arcis JCM 13916]
MSYTTESKAGRSVFPRRTTIEHIPEESLSVSIDQNEGADALRAVSSKTAQKILAVLIDDPHPASDVAEKVGVSVQNVTYHLDRLEDAGIITPVDIWYSEKAREMTVYGITSEKLVIEFGSKKRGKNSDQSA